MFCEACESIDLSALYGDRRLDDKTRESLARELGTVQDIGRRASSCMFCQWMNLNINLYSENANDISSRMVKLFVDANMIYEGREISGATGFIYPIARLRLDPFRENDTIATLRPVRKDLSVGDGKVGSLCRIVDRKSTTIQQFRFWLDACRGMKSHGINTNLCTDKQQRGTEVEGDEISEFRLIDVASRGVVLASLKEEYLALSYVWGPKSAGALVIDDQLVDSLPKTIEDAVEFTHQLGIKHLWVDCICIPQDNPVVRQAQIRRMNHIYHRAFGTIITTGPDASTGLNGISLHPNPHQSLQIDQLLIEWQPWPWKHLMANLGDVNSLFNPWSTRGWTFQEALMCRRRLIFAPQHILLECPSATRQATPTDVFEQIEASFFKDLEMAERNDMLKWNIHLYQQMVDQYLKRNLTHESDIVNAISGIANFIAGAVDSTCCWTIPRRDFLAALMWTPLLKERSLEVRNVLLDDGRIPPSWHWSHLRLRSIGFVEGSEPLEIYPKAAKDFTSRFNEETWKRIEDTSIIPFEGYMVSYQAQGNVHQPPPVDHRQCAEQAWQAKEGSFLSCRSWEFASTVNNIGAPNPLYPSVRRLGDHAKMEPNYQFILLLRWKNDIAYRVGWCMVPLSEWKAANPSPARVWLG